MLGKRDSWRAGRTAKHTKTHQNTPKKIMNTKCMGKIRQLQTRAESGNAARKKPRESEGIQRNPG
jgi:hypothetical protein